MKLAIIRTCDRDDYSAHICYLTMKKHGVADKFIFWHDGVGKVHPLITSTGEDIIYHGECGNFGGLLYVKQMITDLAELPKPEPDDYVIFCDADIIMYKNPFYIMPLDIDHAGIYGEATVVRNIPHVSGQLNIIKGWLWNEYIKGGEKLLQGLYEFQCLAGSTVGTADDTLFSIFAHTKKAKQFSFYGMDCWLHDKINNQQEYERELAKL